MNAIVVYESMYGNTRRVAEAMADRLGAQAVAVADASADRIADADLVVIGAPTHIWGMSRRSTRKAAADAAAKPGSALMLEPGATGAGVREWLADHAGAIRTAATFDTRLKSPAVFTGRASRGIRRALRGAKVRLVAPSQSFFVDKQNRLRDGELDRARAWGEELTSRVPARRSER
jgi:hypothetical protein